MYVVEHTFLDREKAVEAGQALFSPPAGITLQCFLPNVDGSNAICRWEADSGERVKNLVDSTLGDTTKNALFQVDARQAWGLPRQAVAEQASAMLGRCHSL